MLAQGQREFRPTGANFLVLNTATGSWLTTQVKFPLQTWSSLSVMYIKSHSVEVKSLTRFPLMYFWAELIFISPMIFHPSLKLLRLRKIIEVSRRVLTVLRPPKTKRCFELAISTDPHPWLARGIVKLGKISHFLFWNKYDIC